MEPASHSKPPLRVIVALVARGRASVEDDVVRILINELDAGTFVFVRGVTVNREKPFIELLVRNLANGNETDIIVLLGGVGIGPRDYTCEAIEAVADHVVEGFGEAFRDLLREHPDAGLNPLLARASAAICNKCLVVGLPRQPEPIRRAMRRLIVPAANAALRMASGKPE